jgi:hypothetical protein
VNVLGHSHVALALGADSPAYVLGAVLPDLASMARVRLDRSRLDGAVAEGVRCPLATDTAFHTQPAFVAGARAIRDDLRDQGVAAGPARAIGHVGWELLLDGTLLASAASDAYERALAAASDGMGGAVPTAHRERWSGLLSHRHRLPRLPYDDPDWVAERLVAILEPRPALRLPPGQVPAVGAVLGRHATRVPGEAPAVLAETARRAAEHLSTA